MPKRAVTPPIDDGAKYLTVVYPFPSRPDMELESHRKLFAQWVAACVGPRYLRSFYHKMSSPGSIIMEIDESLPDFKKLLGAHKWSEFLKDPKKEAASQTKVFYCTFNSERAVQKYGWKRIDIDEQWFRTPSTGSKFVSPYPETYWCDIPKIGNVIQTDLCRPLPRQDFPPPPPPTPAPIVGTPAWQDWRREKQASRTARAWQRGAPPESVNGRPPPVLSGPAPMTHASSVAPQSTPRQAWAQLSSSESGLPPGLPPGLLRAGSSSGSSNASSSGGGTPLSLAGSGVSRRQVVMAGDRVERALEALAVDDEDEDDDDLYFGVRGSSSASEQKFPDSPQVDSGPVEVHDSLWNEYVHVADRASDEDDEDDDDRGFARAHRKNPLLCPVHNVVCAKGICREMAIRKRIDNNRNRAEERRVQREIALEKRMKRLVKESEENGVDATAVPSEQAPADGQATSPGSQTRALPPHLRAGAPAAPARQPPPHLRRGASATSAPTSPPAISALVAGGRATPTPIRRHDDDDATSRSSGGWGSIASDPWGPSGTPGSRPAPSNKSPNHTNKDSSNKKKKTGPKAKAATPPAAREDGAWGRAPSISASSVRRNSDSTSASGRGGDVAEAVGARSVAASEAVGWGSAASVGAGAGADGPWGNTEAVRAASQQMSMRTGKGSKKKRQGELDARTVVSSGTWGNVSEGPW